MADRTPKITTVYDKFKSWVTTGGQQDNDWYKSHSQDVYPIENLTQLQQILTPGQLYVVNRKNMRKRINRRFLMFFSHVIVKVS